jgi:hypothetical protein
MKFIDFKNFLFLPIGGSSTIRVNFRVATDSKRSVAITRYFRTETADTGPVGRSCAPVCGKPFQVLTGQVVTRKIMAVPRPPIESWLLPFFYWRICRCLSTRTRERRRAICQSRRTVCDLQALGRTKPYRVSGSSDRIT